MSKAGDIAKVSAKGGFNVLWGLVISTVISRLLLGVAIFVLVLVPALLFTRSITKSDVSNLRFMVGGLGILSGLINKVLSLIEKLMTSLRL